MLLTVSTPGQDIHLTDGPKTPGKLNYNGEADWKA